MVRRFLSDSQWKRMEPLLPGKASDCGVTAKDNRQFVEAVLWIARTEPRGMISPRSLATGTEFMGFR
jgi:transposase